MKVAAIIAEYNPFHEGHHYQIEETRKITGADYVLVLMSGDYVQRGMPAVFNKYERCRMALLGGADVVLELPVRYATSSAEFFAGGAVTILDQLQVVDYLSFGSECGSIDPFLQTASVLFHQQALIDDQLLPLLKKGLSYPSAREAVLQEMLPGSDLLSSPNNILGVEYCKALLALHSSITPVTIQRKGMGYHETEPSEGNVYPSASHIRRQLLSSSRFEVLTPDDFSLLLQYQLLKEQTHGFADYLDCSGALSNRIQKFLPSADSFEDFCARLKTKELTYTRISRALLHILLGLKEEPSFSVPLKDRKLPTGYVRLLGFQRSAGALLSSLKNAKIPMISKLADAKDLLSEEAFLSLSRDIEASNLYAMVFASKYQKELLNEYQQSPVIL